MSDETLLQLHLEPNEPIGVEELSAALGSLSRQYQSFASREAYSARPGDARLMVASVAPGSIDINFIPELVLASGLLAPVIPHGELLAKFAEAIGALFAYFRRDTGARPVIGDVSVKDCDDAINLAGIVAQHGGTQQFNIIKGDVYTGPVLHITASDAREIVEGAAREKARLLHPASKPHQRVSMVWRRIDSDETATKGVRSPDKAMIDEIDPERPHAVLFTDEMTYLKAEMMGDSENPYRKVYFVDVEVSRVGERITAYRIVGYHGSDDLD